MDSAEGRVTHVLTVELYNRDAAEPPALVEAVARALTRRGLVRAADFEVVYGEVGDPLRDLFATDDCSSAQMHLLVMLKSKVVRRLKDVSMSESYISEVSITIDTLRVVEVELREPHLTKRRASQLIDALQNCLGELA